MAIIKLDMKGIVRLTVNNRRRTRIPSHPHRLYNARVVDAQKH
jgi:hypothetical protein